MHTNVMGVVSSGGLFEYVSGANYTAEILEWAGFALASWSLPAAVFAAFTALNIGEANTHAFVKERNIKDVNSVEWK